MTELWFESILAQLEPETGLMRVLATSPSLRMKTITQSILSASKFRLPGWLKMDGES
jgi:hypothetical protein